MSNELNTDQGVVLPFLIWAQIVHKGYQQTTKAASKERVKQLLFALKVCKQ